jgi:polysaccharide export outer membrane protein
LEADRAPATYQVGASDQLSYRILPDPAIEGTATVRPDGRISVDLIGDVAAAGRTTEQLARELEQRISEYRQEPLATVWVTAANSATITILGEVGEPGQYPLARDTRLADAIALAGGATQLAAASRVRLIRWDTDRTVVYVANLDEIQGGDGATNAMLVHGDTVFVPPATPVAFGYAIRRALYPVEVVLGTVAGILVGLIAG